MNTNELDLQAVSTESADLRVLFNLLDINFPRKTRIPIFMLRASLKKGRVNAVYLNNRGHKIGYAIFQYHKEYDLIHILYLALLLELRSMGLGSIFPEKLNGISNGRILLDAEDPSAAKTEKEQIKRRQRIEFYLRNGFHVREDFRFLNFGYTLRVLSNCPLPELNLLQLYRQLYDNAYGVPISSLLINKK